MKKLGYLMLVLAIAVMLGGTDLAQGDPTYYFTTYFSNNVANAPDETVRIINDGDTEQNLYADIYVFDDSEELTECCSCVVTPDGLLSESVRKNLTANPLTGIIPTRGVIKVISDFGPFAAINPVPTAGLRAWATHAQKLAAGFSLTETLMADSNLADSERTLLRDLCRFDALLSGQPCTCTPEDQDF
jgi:hypothetical protein